MNLKEFLPQAEAISDWIIDLRRTIHRNPELMYEETKTSALVQKTLSELDVEFEADIAKTGVLATIGKGDGPCVALRADMDALPIHEEADIDFKSQVDGKMHACGHDCHTAMLLGAARILKENETALNGTVKLLFQPAEEGGAGGRKMREHGVLKSPDVQRIFGLHVWPLVESGTITSRTGTFLAGTCSFQIIVNGKGGHAAMPHLAIDPVTTAAKIVTELQTITSRETDPLEPLVISVTTIHGGQAFNVIPPEMKITGTIRSLTADLMDRTQARLKELSIGIAAANQCTAEVSFPGEDYPPTVNDGTCWELASKIWAEKFGETKVSESLPMMGGEDFAFYTEETPGCFVGLGIRNEEKGCVYSVHHPKFKVDEAVLPTGSAMHVAFAFESISELANG